MELDISTAIADTGGLQSNAFKIPRKMTFNLKFHTQSINQVWELHGDISTHARAQQFSFHTLSQEDVLE